MNTPALDNDNSQPGPGPLNGIRVLDVATVYAAPITAMLLGDYGADVLKIEHPRGDPARTHGLSKDGYGLWWKVLARNKRAITLNLSHSAGRELLEQLAAGYPVPRLGTAREVADLICFAASEEAGYITGASFDINGGDLMM